MSTYSDTILATTGLIAYWHLNDAASGTAEDLGPGSHDGTSSATPGTGPSLVLNEPGGSSGVFVTANGDRIDIAHHADFDNDHVSIEAWIQPHASVWTQHAPIFNLRTVGNVGGYTLQTNTASGTITLYTDQGAGFESTDSTDWALGSTSHIVATYDGHRHRIYRNGALVATGASDLNAVLNQPVDPYIAIGRAPDTLVFNGTIDAVSVYSVALDLATIGAHYSVGLSEEDNGYDNFVQLR
jgi:hypothetical protein